MKMKIARGLLYLGVISLAAICLMAAIDNYDLAINQGISSTQTCYNTEIFDINTGETRLTEQCDQYNPQFVFFVSIFLLVSDALLFLYFNRMITNNAQVGRAFERELNDLNKKYSQDDNHKNKNNLFTV